jgi:SagB-type dehydrogenase family enzyme
MIRELDSVTVPIGCRARDIDDPAEIYHEASRYYPRSLGLPMGGLALGSVLPGGASGPNAFRHVDLPEPSKPDVSLAAALNSRRSLRPGGRTITLATISTLLHAAYGVTDRQNPEHRRRAVPSAGGLYPLDWYFAGSGVDRVPTGLYHYDSLAHRLEVVRAGNVCSIVGSSVLTAGLATDATATFIATASFERSRRKYGLRAYRFVLMEAGHSMQNLLLMASCLGLHVTPVGGFLDGVLDDLLGIDGVEEATLYVAVVG